MKDSFADWAFPLVLYIFLKVVGTLKKLFQWLLKLLTFVIHIINKSLMLSLLLFVFNLALNLRDEIVKQQSRNFNFNFKKTLLDRKIDNWNFWVEEIS